MSERRLPDHVTTPLLALVTSRSLDEDYAHVARRRGAAGPPERSPRRGSWWLSALVVAAFGILVAVAAVQNSRNAATEELGRATLLAQIEASRGELAGLQERAATLSNTVRTAQERTAILQEQQRELNNQLRQLEVRTGYVAVRGPGVRMTIDDNPTGDITTEVRDEDLATLVDGLWEAGAEAIAVNGQRLTVLTGIRNSGRAIHISGEPLTPPYTLQAIGDPGSLQANLLDTSQGARWFVLVRSLGFEFDAQSVEELRLPAADLRPLRHVEPGLTEDSEGRPTELEGTL